MMMVIVPSRLMPSSSIGKAFIRRLPRSSVRVGTCSETTD